MSEVIEVTATELETFTVPDNLEDLFSEIGRSQRNVQAHSWRTAAMVYAGTYEGTGGPRTGSKMSQLSLREFAERGERGLTSRNTVVKYRKIMQWAIDRNLCEEPEQGKTIKLPAVEEFPEPKKIRGTQGTGDNEWYTPVEYIVAVRDVLGVIVLDPASSDHAQKTVRANRHFTKDDDGLKQSWQANTVYLNPPYAQPFIYNFTEKLISELIANNIKEAILLTHNYTDTLWFHRAEEVASAICFTRGRIPFVNADGEKASPTQGQAFFYFGECPDVFAARFKEYGFVR